MVDAPLLVKIDALLNHFGAGAGLVVIGVVAHSFKDAHHRTMLGLGTIGRGLNSVFSKNDSLEIGSVDFLLSLLVSIQVTNRLILIDFSAVGTLETPHVGTG